MLTRITNPRKRGYSCRSKERTFLIIKNMIKEIYYWMVFYLRKVPTNDMPQFNAYLLISMLLCFNILTCVILFCFLLRVDIKSLTSDYKVIGFIFGLSIMIPNYFLLFAKRKEITEKYDKLPKKRRIKGIILFWIYSIVSIPLYVILVVNLAR